MASSGENWQPQSPQEMLPIPQIHIDQSPMTAEAPSPNIPNPRQPLPDIYTLCPDLRSFHSDLELPELSPIDRPTESSAETFDPDAQIIRPHELGFVPRSEWPPQTMSLLDIRLMYFTRRNGAARQFDYKLYNALCITKRFPEAYQYVGAKWVTDSVMKIDSTVFGNLLGIHAVQGGLFHKQGNFSRHGFSHIFKQNLPALSRLGDVQDVDDYNIRLYIDSQNRFTKDSDYDPN